MPKNPQHCTKKTLLNCVDILNKTCSLKPLLQVKTKTIEVILASIYCSLQDLNPFVIIEDTPQEVLCELVIWGCLDIDFLGEEVPEATLKVLEGIGDNVIQAEDTLEWNSDLEEKSDEEIDNTEETIDPPTNLDDLKDKISILTEKLAKAEKKGKQKKIDKIKAELDVVKQERMALKEEQQEKPKVEEPKLIPNPRVAEINGLIETLKDNMPEKKKKAKKVQAKIDELTEELGSIPAEISATSGKTKKPKVKDGAPTRGVTARASRPIPDKIAWPKPESITGTIVSCCQGKKGATIAEVIEVLAETFPNRAVSGMTKTVNALIGGVGLPLPLHYTKGIPCEVEGDGTPEKRIFIRVKA